MGLSEVAEFTVWCVWFLKSANLFAVKFARFKFCFVYFFITFPLKMSRLSKFQQLKIEALQVS